MLTFDILTWETPDGAMIAQGIACASFPEAQQYLEDFILRETGEHHIGDPAMPSCPKEGYLIATNSKALYEMRLSTITSRLYTGNRQCAEYAGTPSQARAFFDGFRLGHTEEGLTIEPPLIEIPPGYHFTLEGQGEDGKAYRHAISTYHPKPFLEGFIWGLTGKPADSFSGLMGGNNLATALITHAR